MEEINFCLRCGSRVTQAERFGRLRYVCPACDWVYFADPKVAAAVLVEQGGGVLLVRPSMSRSADYGAYPAEFIDAGEDPAAAAAASAWRRPNSRYRSKD